MMESFELWHAIVEAAGAKRVANATGYNVATVYRAARHPLDEDDINGTGERGVLDRFEAVVDLLAARASTRVTLRKLQVWTAGLFERALDRGEAHAIPQADLAAHAVKALRELADVIDECGKGDPDEERLINEVIEVEAILDKIRRAAEATLIAEQPRLRKLN